MSEQRSGRSKTARRGGAGISGPRVKRMLEQAERRLNDRISDRDRSEPGQRA